MLVFCLIAVFVFATFILLDVIRYRQRPAMHLYRSTRKHLPSSRHSLKVMVYLQVIRIFQLRSASEIIGTAELVGLFLDSSFAFADKSKGRAASGADVAP
jgi:hypothetical protein